MPFVSAWVLKNLFKFKPPDRIFKLYKSTTINTAEKRLPWFYIIGIGGLVLFGLLIAIYSFGKLFLKKMR